jgi:carotenoid cleavage dioxygenase-like enzyme
VTEAHLCLRKPPEFAGFRRLRDGHFNSGAERLLRPGSKAVEEHSDRERVCDRSARKSTTVHDIFQHPIFRSAPERTSVEANVAGALPSWLSGDLIRTAPAVFRQGSFRARHWFDGLGLVYAFRLGADGRVHFRQHLLESETARRIASGLEDTPHFGTPMNRPFWNKLLSPVPRPNDNANVVIRQIGEQLVAMTETPMQIEVDRDTLRAIGPVRYEDDLGDHMLMLAHPHADLAGNKVINVATDLSARAGLVVYEHSLTGRRRRSIARVPFGRVPYLHSFGLTPRHAVLLCAPFVVRPWKLLWSDKAYIEHFRWQPERGTMLARVDRTTGKVTRHRAPPMFVFHTINAFERDDETVLDVLAYDDATIVQRLSADALAHSLPELSPRPTRIMLRHHSDEARVESLHDGRFEFPVIDYRRCSGRSYGVAFGTAYESRGGAYESCVMRVDLQRGAVRRFDESGWIFGEPLFVAKPHASREGEGVLVAVAGHAGGERSAMAVIDAETLDRLAWAELDLPIPLGFHGSFLRSPLAR